MSVLSESPLRPLMPPRDCLLSLLRDPELLFPEVEDGREPLDDEALDDGREPELLFPEVDDGREPELLFPAVDDGREPVACWLPEEEDPVEGRDALPLAPSLLSVAPFSLFFSSTVVCPDTWVEDLETEYCCVSPVFALTSTSAVSAESPELLPRARFLTRFRSAELRLAFCFSLSSSTLFSESMTACAFAFSMESFSAWRFWIIACLAARLMFRLVCAWQTPAAIARTAIASRSFPAFMVIVICGSR